MKMIKILISIYFQIMIIKCEAVCNKETNLPPSSEFHCSGLKIDPNLNGNDKYCCYWTFIDSNTLKPINRCSSINKFQFDNLNEYIVNKTERYPNLDIMCTQDQKIYCSNVVLDEEQTANCNTLAIYDKKDKYCCRWKFEDSENYMKKNDYCASINEFEYLNIKEYIKYKSEDKSQRYDNLEIDCREYFISFSKMYILSFIISLFL